MRTIIAGPRDIADEFCPDGKNSCTLGSACPCQELAYEAVKKAVADCPWEITTVISGTAKGVDTLGERWAKEHGVTVERYPANWSQHGRAAGPIRNGEMAEIAENAVILWNGVSRGTKDMINRAKKKQLGLFIHRTDM